MPSQPHTFTHRITAVEVARCDHGATLRPTGHRMAHYALSLISSVMSSATVTHMTTATVTSSSSPCLPPVSLLVWPSTLQAETAHYRSVTAQCPVTSDGTIYRIVSNIAILIHIVAYLYRDNYPSNEVDIPHNSAIRPWFILAMIKLM